MLYCTQRCDFQSLQLAWWVNAPDGALTRSRKTSMALQKHSVRQRAGSAAARGWLSVLPMGEWPLRASSANFNKHY